MSTTWAELPASWSNKSKVERLEQGAYGSLTRMLGRAVAETGTNFSIYSALRTREEQHALFVANYRDTGKKYPSGDRPRKYQGTYWARRPDSVAVAVPGSPQANHESGLAIDIHPGAIQAWMKVNGRRFGWDWAEGKRNGEDWHFRYRPEWDRYRGEGVLDHAAVQRAVGAVVDGKIGTGTVARIKAKQAELGLEVDGKVGPATKAALLGGGEPAPIPVVVAGGASVPAPVEERTVLAATDDGILDWADAETQFWDDKYPNATYQGGQPIGLLHSTETGTWPGYGGGSSAPHLTVRLDPATKTLTARQHYSLTRPSRALVNRSGGVQTNNQHVVQIELIGSCDRSFATKHGYPFLPDLLTEDWARDALAGVLKAVSASLSIPLTTSVEWKAYPGSYGEKAPQRLTGAQWEAYTGWLGHQHAPENTHGDPGNIPIDAILAAARGDVAVPVNTPAAPVPSPTISGGLPEGKDLLMKLTDVPDFPLLRTEGHKCFYGLGPELEAVSGKMPNSLAPGDIETVGGKTRSKGLMTLQRQLVKRGYSVDVDGRWGAQMDNAIDNVQRLAGLARDKKCGPMTWFAAFLLPVQQ